MVKHYIWSGTDFIHFYPTAVLFRPFDAILRHGSSNGLPPVFGGKPLLEPLLIHFEFNSHYNDVIMGELASKFTSLTIVYSTVNSGTDERKHQSSASLAFVLGIHRWPVNSPHKWPVTRKMFPFDDVIMPANKFQSNFNNNATIFIQEHVFENAVIKMSFILFNIKSNTLILYPISTLVDKVSNFRIGVISTEPFLPTMALHSLLTGQLKFK